MTLLFIILIIVACVVLSLIVLVQNPKGGGLAGNVAGFSNQFMGVKQTTDVLEKGTWLFAAIIGILCIVSTVFIPGSHSPRTNTPVQQQESSQPVQNPAGVPGPGK
ncbi:MAG TPA: preprotein translocase subunit SecG [Flavisolibacter sp.]|nr:preprotein translocase subunit SecG [Flavisolibacter sp.]